MITYSGPVARDSREKKERRTHSFNSHQVTNIHTHTHTQAVTAGSCECEATDDWFTDCLTRRRSTHS